MEGITQAGAIVKTVRPVSQTHAATQALLFDRGLCITAKRIAPWEGVGKQFGKLLVELL
jgi:hypothetical protein